MHALRDPRGHGDSLRRLSRARFLLRKRKEWWESAFDAHYLLEYGPLFTPEGARAEVSRLIEILGLPVGSQVLDVPCGQGRHSHLLAEAGYEVDGVDYSADLLKTAARRGKGPHLRYHRCDMRKLPTGWRNRFDAVLNLFTSFGFFAHPKGDATVIAEFARVLAPGGRLVWHGASRDGVMARFLERDWWSSGDHALFAQEREFDPLSGILTVASTWRRGQRSGVRRHAVRLYTATRIAELCSAAGLVVEEAYDGFSPRALSRTSTEMLLVATKR